VKAAVKTAAWWLLLAAVSVLAVAGVAVGAAMAGVPR
jgi:hypothetical protein